MPPRAFVQKLDSLFSADSSLEGETTSSDISGLIGQYAHGNEPSHHVIHLYNYVNHPWRTQELVDSVYRSQYANSIEGLSGNEDCGQMSAWYILNSMGFYQVCPLVMFCIWRDSEKYKRNVLWKSVNYNYDFSVYFDLIV